MNQQAQHFARKRRQLAHASRRVSDMLQASQGRVTQQVDRLMKRIHKLVHELRHVCSISYFKRVLGGVAFLMGASATTGQAQSFAPAVSNPFGAGVQTASEVLINFELVDMDGDGDLDLVGVEFPTGYSDYYSLNLAFQENTGTPESAVFGPIESGFPMGFNPNNFEGWDQGYVGGSLGIDVVDLDGDGDYDVVMGAMYAYMYSQSPYAYDYFTSAMFWIENIGTPSDPQLWGGIDINPFGIDLSALPAESYAYNYAFEFADIDGDGDQDLLGTTYEYSYDSNTASYRFFWCENAGSSTAPSFLPPAMSPFGLTPSAGGAVYEGLSFSLQALDLDQDGDLDLIHSVYFEGAYNEFSEFHYFENTGSANNPGFIAGVVNPFGLQDGMTPGVRSMQFADIDADGDLDCFANDFFSAMYSYGETYVMEFQENTAPVMVSGPAAPSFSLFPNPASEFIRFEWGEVQPERVEIFNMQGAHVMQCNPYETQANIGHLTPGSYLLRAETNEGSVSQVFMIQ